MPPIDVREVHSFGRIAIFEMTIQYLSRYQHDCVYTSRGVTYFNREWRLSIVQNESSLHYLCLGRRELTSDVGEPVYCSIQCRTSNGAFTAAVQEQRVPQQRGQCLPINVWWTIPTVTLVILTVSLRKGDPLSTPGICLGTQTEDAERKDFTILSKDFKELLLSGTGHDILLKVGDQQFRAHKCVLQVRSPVFAAMLSNQMAESADGSVTIEDCDSDAFGQFLQFLYTGKVDITSVDSALGVYHAGEKYDIPRLKEISVAFMKSSFAATNVFDVVSFGARHGEEELLQLATVYFGNHLEEVLVTEEWQRFHVANPIQANELYLKAALCLRSSHPDKRKRRRTDLSFS